MQAVKEQLAVDTEGLTVSQIRSMHPWMSKAALEIVEWVLRKDPDISETKERRVNAAGRMQEQVVLRLSSASGVESVDIHELP